jgi:alpha-mannosidase
VAVEVTREAEGSTFVQRIRLGAGGAGARIEFDNDVEWKSRERSLRVAFPLTVSNPTATYDIQAGVIERPNSHPKEYEYPFHQWLDLSDAKGDYGVTAMCDSKYASDKPDDHTVRLTLLYTPGTRGGYQDQGSQDIGRHQFTYALYGHGGDWKKGLSPLQGSRLNQPLIPFRSNAHAGPLGKTFSLARVSDPGVSISAVKKAEDSGEVIVRLRELTGAGVKGVKVSMARPIVSAREVDGQEREIGAATVQNGELVTDVHGLGLRAFALKLGEAPAKVAGVTSTPVALAFDTDAVSTRTNRADGGFDDKGRTLPAERLPASVSVEGVTFNFGPTADGQKNAVACRGQEIRLPAGDYDRVYLIAAANEELVQRHCRARAGLYQAGRGRLVLLALQHAGG